MVYKDLICYCNQLGVLKHGTTVDGRNLANHLGYIKPCGKCDKLPIDRWFRIYINSIAGILARNINWCLQTCFPVCHPSGGCQSVLPSMNKSASADGGTGKIGDGLIFPFRY